MINEIYWRLNGSGSGCEVSEIYADIFFSTYFEDTWIDDAVIRITFTGDR